MDICDWRTRLTPDSRQKVVKKIVGTLKKHFPYSGPADQLNKIAARFEDKTFSGAVNQTDYVRKLSMKMLTLETKSQNATGSSSSIPAVDTAAWRTHMPPGSRKKIVNKILEILKKQPPFSGSDEGINELRRIAARFEDNIFRGAVNQTDYLRKISAKIVTMKNDSKNAAVSSSSFLYPNYGTSMDSDAEDMENGNSEPCLVNEELAVNTSDWRTELPPNSRQRNAYKMLMETLEMHVPNLGLQGINELMRIAVSFEDLIFQTAINQNREPIMDTGDWRTQFPSDSRSRVVNKIMETLIKQLPFIGPEGINELRKIAVRFEDKIFSNAINQTEYLRQISFKMLSMETKSQNAASSSSSVFAADDNSPPLVPEPSLPNNEPDVNSSDWRTQQPPDSRQKNIYALLETLKKNVPYSGKEGIDELMRIAVSFEELIFNTAISQEDYLGKISLKMRTM
ncbi:unnamed protein product [Arabidopsis arenosa]|uniref:Mediator complex subunit 15 KIX domain-containing protein n=1 Tax=Arabidopsis arenosa TaxID=38785 RepID=A0A8S1ZGA0_ARAAE|nr:unnamed protein product [Arabidopsis arenosa]